MDLKWKSKIFLLVRTSISVGLLYYLFKKTDWQRLGETLQRIHLPYYLLSLLCVITFQTLVSYRWEKICAIWNFRKPFLFFLKGYLMSVSLNTVFPGIVAGDALRGTLLIKAGLPWKMASLSLLFDRGYGLFGIFLILSVSLPLFGKFLPKSFLHFLTLFIYFGIFTFVIITTIGSNVLKNKLDTLKPLFYPNSLLPVGLGFLIQILFVLQYVFLSQALNLVLPVKVLFVIIPVVSFLSALPLSISGLGVREGTLSYFLHLLGYPLEYGMALGLLGYSLILLSAIPGLVFYLSKSWK